MVFKTLILAAIFIVFMCVFVNILKGLHKFFNIEIGDSYIKETKKNKNPFNLTSKKTIYTILDKKNGYVQYKKEYAAYAEDGTPFVTYKHISSENILTFCLFYVENYKKIETFK